jgi:hypothetical protein
MQIKLRESKVAVEVFLMNKDQNDEVSDTTGDATANKSRHHNYSSKGKRFLQNFTCKFSF